MSAIRHAGMTGLRGFVTLCGKVLKRRPRYIQTVMCPECNAIIARGAEQLKRGGGQ